MHLTLCLLLTLLFCFLLGISPRLRDFKTVAQKTALCLVAIFGIITGIIGIGIAGLVSNHPGASALCQIVVLIAMFTADHVRLKLSSVK